MHILFSRMVIYRMLWNFMTIAHFRLAYTGMHDSQLCIEFLTGKFQNDISSSLEQSTARAYQIMGEDHLFWQVLVSSQTHLIILFIVLYVSTRVLD